MHPNAGRKQTPEHVAKRVAAVAAARAARPEVEKERLAKWRASVAANPDFLNAALANIAPYNKIGRRMPQSVKDKISAEHKGKQYCLGHTPTEEHRRNISAHWAANPEKHPNYIDGRSAERKTARAIAMSRIEYRLWREAVYARDNWTCVSCGARGVQLHADHVKPYAAFPEMRYEVDNGRTLCVPCHRKTDTFGAKALKHRSAEFTQ